jgi:uncharacterized C2H2 Zn-finger protein
MNIAKNRKTKSDNFLCEKCGYTTQSKKDYTKHISTAKHLKLTENPKKSQTVYECILCNYHTINRYDFDKHQNTAKHKKRSGNTGYDYVLPPLADCRAAWDKFIGHEEEWG